MRMTHFSIFSFIVTLVLIGNAQAQDACPTLEQAAIAEAGIWCANTQVGQACYGNAQLLVEGETTLQNVGDIAPLNDITQLQTVINREQTEWGIARLDTSSYSPDDWRDKRVSIIIMGDALIQNQVETPIITITTPVTSAQGANVRRAPNAEAGILRAVREDEFVKITGRSDDGIWLRVQGLDGSQGWLTSSAVTVANGDTLAIVDMDSPAPTALFRAFAHSTITAETLSACDDAPASGVLIQSEDILNGVVLRLNDRDVVLKGTLFVRGAPTETQYFVIEGVATIDGRDVAGGQVIRTGEGASQIGGYDVSLLEGLPINLLPRFIYLAVDTSNYLTPRPVPDRSPIADVLVDEPCRFTTGQSGTNLRAGPGTEYPIQGVMAYRESASPIGRVVGRDGSQWWQIAPYLWARTDTTVTGGDCISVPNVTRIPAPPPVTPTPSND
jgi:hypothetical protein